MSNEELPYKCDYPNCPLCFKTPRGRTLHFGSETLQDRVPPLFPTICPPVILPEKL
jgi:hypothetical protein